MYVPKPIRVFYMVLQTVVQARISDILGPYFATKMSRD